MKSKYKIKIHILKKGKQYDHFVNQNSKDKADFNINQTLNQN